MITKAELDNLAATGPWTYTVDSEFGAVILDNKGNIQFLFDCDDNSNEIYVAALNEWFELRKEKVAWKV